MPATKSTIHWPSFPARLQYLLVSEQEPARRKALQTIVGQTQRIHRTLTQLMQFARPPVPRKQHVDLAGLPRCGRQFAILADERQVRLISPESPMSLTLSSNAGQMHTAIAALLRNAIEAAPANGWASVAVQHEAHAVSIVVEDSGPGLSVTDHEHLFDPFYSGAPRRPWPRFGSADSMATGQATRWRSASRCRQRWSNTVCPLASG